MLFLKNIRSSLGFNSRLGAPRREQGRTERTNSIPAATSLPISTTAAPSVGAETSLPTATGAVVMLWAEILVHARSGASWALPRPLTRRGGGAEP